MGDCSFTQRVWNSHRSGVLITFVLFIQKVFCCCYCCCCCFVCVCVCVCVCVSVCLSVCLSVSLSVCECVWGWGGGGVCIKSDFFFLTQPCWLALHQWWAEKGWLVTSLILLPHTPALCMTSLYTMVGTKWQHSRSCGLFVCCCFTFKRWFWTRPEIKRKSAVCVYFYIKIIIILHKIILKINMGGWGGGAGSVVLLLFGSPLKELSFAG